MFSTFYKKYSNILSIKFQNGGNFWKMARVFHKWRELLTNGGGFSQMAGIIDKWQGFFTNGGSSDLPFNGNVVIICRGRWEARISIHKYRSFHSSPQGSLPNHIYTACSRKLRSSKNWFGTFLDRTIFLVKKCKISLF